MEFLQFVLRPIAADSEPTDADAGASEFRKI